MAWVTCLHHEDTSHLHVLRLLKLLDVPVVDVTVILGLCIRIPCPQEFSRSSSMTAPKRPRRHNVLCGLCCLEHILSCICVIAFELYYRSIPYQFDMKSTYTRRQVWYYGEP